MASEARKAWRALMRVTVTGGYVGLLVAVPMQSAQGWAQSWSPWLMWPLWLLGCAWLAARLDWTNEAITK